FSSLINIEGNQWHYHIPRFQREYIWKKHNWSKLLEDIYDRSGHYMGSVICVHDATTELSPSDGFIYEVVDGQQRLTTISLLLAAIYFKLTNEIATEDSDVKQDDDYIIKVNSIRQRLIKKLLFSGNKPTLGCLQVWEIDIPLTCTTLYTGKQSGGLSIYP
ncbi:DUF262 domain-containing protein, partial [Candidatus Villigracilis affinis]|uniref:DUF262 domain-containing protein n=1 Tax=Candidatus Villigracilis affinis TaxID=3140682 RepID=UPI002A1B8E5C|nr:DUF262 domain-containing protein [Anaerolineales bacterium]